MASRVTQRAVRLRRPALPSPTTPVAWCRARSQDPRSHSKHQKNSWNLNRRYPSL